MTVRNYFTFEVPGVPQGKARPRFTIQNGKVHTYTPRETKDYENLIKSYFLLNAEKYGVKPIGKGVPLGLAVTVCMPVPESWAKDKKENAYAARLRPTTKPDVDNVLKIVQDALNKVAYYDDAQIVWSGVSKMYMRKPRLDIAIYCDDYKICQDDILEDEEGGNNE